MYRPILTAILLVLILIVSGCSSTRKAVTSEYAEQRDEQTTSTIETQTLSEGNIINHTQSSEQITAVIDFTRYEFEDGTFLNLNNPIRAAPDSVNGSKHPEPGKGVKAITKGRINLNKQTEGSSETAIATTDQQSTSQNTEINTTSEISQQSKIIKKPKRGVIYYLGLITASTIALILLYWLARFIKPLIKK